MFHVPFRNHYLSSSFFYGRNHRVSGTFEFHPLSSSEKKTKSYESFFLLALCGLVEGYHQNHRKRKPFRKRIRFFFSESSSSDIPFVSLYLRTCAATRIRTSTHAFTKRDAIQLHQSLHVLPSRIELLSPGLQPDAQTIELQKNFVISDGLEPSRVRLKGDCSSAEL